MITENSLREQPDRTDGHHHSTHGPDDVGGAQADAQNGGQHQNQLSEQRDSELHDSQAGDEGQDAAEGTKQLQKLQLRSGQRRRCWCFHLNLLQLWLREGETRFVAWFTLPRERVRFQRQRLR